MTYFLFIGRDWRHFVTFCEDFLVKCGPGFSNPVNSLQMGFAGIAVGAAMVRLAL